MQIILRLNQRLDIRQNNISTNKFCERNLLYLVKKTLILFLMTQIGSTSMVGINGLKLHA